MSLSELFTEFKYKPGDFVTLAMQTVSLERTREITNVKYDEMPILPKAKFGSESYAEELIAYEDAMDKALFNPPVQAMTSAPLPTMYQVSSRALRETFGGVITPEYHIEGEDGSKLHAHEDELIKYERPTTTATADVDTSINP